MITTPGLQDAVEVVEAVATHMICRAPETALACLAKQLSSLLRSAQKDHLCVLMQEIACGCIAKPLACGLISR